jgi:hypothetical protein
LFDAFFDSEHAAERAIMVGDAAAYEQHARRYHELARTIKSTYGVDPRPREQTEVAA